MSMSSKVLLLAFVSFCYGLAQSPPPIPVGTSYTPAAVIAAPGQLITLIVEGITNRPPPTVATGGQDLPNSLAGIMVSYFVFDGTPVPILQVLPYYGGCNASMFTICSQLGAVTIQVPFEAQCELCSNGGVPPQSVTLAQDGVGGRRMVALTLPDQVHILTTCDTFVNSIATGTISSTTGLPCPSVVTHPDGSPVTADSPAEPGEEVVAYAVGLGQTNPPLQTGNW